MENLNSLMNAVKFNNVDKVKILLQNKWVDPSAQNNYAIRLAAERGHTEIVKLLLQDGRADPSVNNNYAIGLSAQNGHIEVVELLLQDERIDPGDDDNYAIGSASKYGHIEVVKLLLQNPRVDPSDDDNYAIRNAAKNGHTEVVRLLLQDGRSDPSAKNNQAIRNAAVYGHTAIVRFLLQDPRVDWRVVKDNPIVQDLLNRQNQEMKDQYIASYLSLKKETTRTLDLGRTDEGQQTLAKSLLNPSTVKRISYEGFYEELCSNIPPNIKIPPMKLIALADALKIKYDFNNINWTELCAKVKTSLHLIIFH